MRTHVSIRCTNKLSELEGLSRTVTEFGEAHQLPEKLVFEVNLALEEVLTNVISYGYDDRNKHDIIIHLSVQAGEVLAEVEDDGRPFNPLEAAEPDLGKPVEERPIGGLGIYLVRKVMDGLEYTRQQGKNRLVMKKQIPVT